MGGTYGGKKTYSTVTVSAPCHIQKGVGNQAIDRFGVDSAQYTAWADVNLNVRRDDQIVGDDGRTYFVTDITEQGKDVAMNDHKELILREHNK